MDNDAISGSLKDGDSNVGRPITDPVVLAQTRSEAARRRLDGQSDKYHADATGHVAPPDHPWPHRPAAG